MKFDYKMPGRGYSALSHVLAFTPHTWKCPLSLLDVAPLLAPPWDDGQIPIGSDPSLLGCMSLLSPLKMAWAWPGTTLWGRYSSQNYTGWYWLEKKLNPAWGDTWGKERGIIDNASLDYFASGWSMCLCLAPAPPSRQNERPPCPRLGSRFRSHPLAQIPEPQKEIPDGAKLVGAIPFSFWFPRVSQKKPTW